MKTSIWITAIYLGLFLGSPLAAQMHSGRGGDMPMDTMMHDHMVSMADLMSGMAEAMQAGWMSPEEQAQCGTFMKRLSDMMRATAADPEQGKTAQRQRELKKLEGEWDYWKDEHEEH